MKRLEKAQRVLIGTLVSLLGSFAFLAITPTAFAVLNSITTEVTTVESQAIVPSSEWTSVIRFQISNSGTAPAPVRFHGITVTIDHPGGAARTSFRNAFLAEVGLARESLTNSRYHPPSHVNSDIILSTRSIPAQLDASSIRIRIPAEGVDLRQTIGGGPGVNYYIIVRSSAMPNNAVVRIGVDFQGRDIELSGNMPADALEYTGILNSAGFRRGTLTCVDNVEDWIPRNPWEWTFNDPVGPNADGYDEDLGVTGLANTTWESRFPRELDFYPPDYPVSRVSAHPDAREFMYWLPQPVVLPADCTPYSVFGIELGGGYAESRLKLSSMTFRLLSPGEKKDHLSDGIDNDGDGFVDNTTILHNWALPNRNDDWDFWVDLDRDSVFTPGVDPVLIDVNANGIADVNDTVMFEGNVFGRKLQLVGRNDDEDAWFGDYLRSPESSRVFFPRVDEVLKEDEGEGNIWANTKGFYDGTSIDGTQIGDEVLYYGVQANLNAYGEEVSDAAEDDRNTPTSEWGNQWVNADFWTGTYNRTRPTASFASQGAFFDYVENGYYLTVTDPVVVIRDSGSVKGILDTGDELISYPGSSSNPLPLNNVNNLANRFLLMKGINVRGLNDDYLFNHPRTDEGIANLLDRETVLGAELVAYAEEQLALPGAQEALGIFDVTEYYRIPIGDFNRLNSSGVRVGEEIWIDINLDGRLTTADRDGCQSSPLLNGPPPEGIWTDTLNDRLVPRGDVLGSGSNIFTEESEERYNGIDDDGDGYIDEDCSDYRLFLLIDEDDYDFYVSMGSGPFDPNRDPYYLDLNADGVYQEDEWLNREELEELGVSDPLTLDVEYLLQPGIIRLDNDSDGRENEDPRRRVGNDPNVTLKPIHPELIDEDGFDLIDNDGDGLIDEDSWYVPLFPLVDEERLDYFVDQEGGIPGIYDDGIDEYYIDLNGNGVYDPIVPYFKGGAWRQEMECVFPGRDGVPDIPAGFAFSELMGVDNDMDGLVNEDVRDPNMQIYDFDGNYSNHRNDGFQLWADTDGNGRFDANIDTLISNGYSWQRILPNGVPTNTSNFDNGINEDYMVTVHVNTVNTASLIPITDTGTFDFFMAIRTDSGDTAGAPSGSDKDGNKELKLMDMPSFGVDWGDDFSLQVVTDGTRMILNNNSARSGMSLAQEQTKRQPCLFYAADMLGFYGNTANNSFDDDNDGRMSEEFLNGLDDDGDGEDDDGNPLTPARADGIDNNLNGYIDEGIDKDYRHLFANGLDEDGDAEPGSPVDFFTGLFMADGIDNNGDGRIDEGIDEEIPNGYDDDGDGEDDDGNPFTRARADGIDNDGDGLVDEGIDEDCGDFGVGHGSPFSSARGYWGGWQPEAVHQFVGVPYVDATSAPIPVIGLNVTDAPSYTGIYSTEVMDSIRVNFVTEPLEGDGVFHPSDLMPLSSTDLSGVALYRDRKDGGTVGVYDPGDIFVPISATDLEWNADPSDPIVRNGGHYMVLKPTAGQDIPNSDYPISSSNWGDFGYDYFVCIRTSKHIDYHDAFRCFIRDGDVKFRNSRNATGSGIDGDPIAANVPTFLNDLVVPPVGQTAMPIRSDSLPTAVIGMDMHDSNRTFEGRPSKLSHVLVHFYNVGGDSDFTSTDLAPFYQGYGQWVEIDPRTGTTIPFTGGNVAGKRIGSRCGVALYRDAPGSDTPGGFDNPFDLNVTNPDTPVLLSGYEDWNFMLGWAYQVVLELDPPMLDGSGQDRSLVDPFDPEFYETLPDVDETEGLGNDFFVVIKTSPTISYGDDFYVSVATTVMGGWTIQPLHFFPFLLNSGTHPFPWTPPFTRATSFEDVNTQVLRCPTITITSFRDLTSKDNRADATSDPIPVFGFDYHSDTLARETVNAVRVQVRNVSGFTPQMDLRPILGSLDGFSGVELYRDANGNGVWDQTDTRVAIKASQWENVYYADNPGPDGILGTSDDLGTIGVYDPGIDELFLDDGFIPGYYDLGDTLIEDGVDNIRQTIPTSYDIQDATLYALPSGEERWSLLMVPQTPIPVPQVFDGIPDLFLVARTSSRIDFRDQFAFEMSRAAVRFTSGQSRGNEDITSGLIKTNVPTYLVDNTLSAFNGIMRSATTGYPAVAINMVNRTSEMEYLSSFRLKFHDINNGTDPIRFDPAIDLKPVRPVLVDDGFGNKILNSGVAIYRDWNGDGVFDPRVDKFIRLVPPADPNLWWTGLGNGSYEIVLTFDPVGQDDLLRVPMDDDFLETAGYKSDFFIVLMPSYGSDPGDDFELEIPSNYIRFRHSGTSGERLRTGPITLNVNAPPFIILDAPPSSTFYQYRVTESGQVPFYTILWQDGDNDDNASVDLFYHPEINWNRSAWVTIAQGIEEDDPANSYNWNISNILSGTYRVVAIIDDGFNAPVLDRSHPFVVSNATPTIEITRPVTDMITAEDTFRVEWIDSDPDNDAEIRLYIAARVLEPTHELTPGDILEATLVVQGLSEDQDGNFGSYDLNLLSLRRNGTIEYNQPFTVIATIDDRNPPRTTPGVFDAMTFSRGTITYSMDAVTKPILYVLQPAEDTDVRRPFSYTIEWDARIPLDQEGSITLRYSKDNFNYGNADQIVDGIPEDMFAASSLIFSGSLAADEVSDGTYEWQMAYLDGDSVELLHDLEPGTKYYIYGQVETTSGDVVGNFSAGRLFVNRRDLEILKPDQPNEPADQTYTIEWRYFTDKGPGRVNLFYDTDRIPGGEAPIATGLIPNNGYPDSTTRGRYVWDVKDLPNGTYYIYATFRDGYDGLISEYSKGSVGIFRTQPVSIFMMDYYGQFHFDKVGYTPNVPLNFGWDVARSVKVDPVDAKGYYVLDAFGGLYPFGMPNYGSLYYSQDGVKDIEIALGGGGYYILNGYGLVDCAGSARFYGDPPFTGQDRYVDLEPTLTGNGYYVLDIDGAIHTFGDATPFVGPLLEDSNAVDIELTPDGKGMYLLDDRGAVHALGEAVYHGEVYMGMDVARDLLVTSNGGGYVVLDAYGSVYRFGVAPVVQLVTQELIPPAAKDLEFGRGYVAGERRVIARLENQYAQPDVSADYVVWSGVGTEGKDIFLYDIVQDSTRVLVSRTKDQLNPAINGNKVVYTTLQTGRKEIYGVTIPSGTAEAVPFAVATSSVQQEQPDICCDYVVWSAYDGAQDNWNILMKRIDQTTPVNLTPDTPYSDERNPKIDVVSIHSVTHTFVVWESWRDGQCDVYLSDGVRAPRAITSGSGDQYQPQISYPWVSYTDGNNVKMYDIENGVTRDITNLPALQWKPAMGRSFTAWIDRRNNDLWDIYLFDLLSGESRVTSGYQILDTLSAAAGNIVSVEYSGNVWTLVLRRWQAENVHPAWGQ